MSHFHLVSHVGNGFSVPLNRISVLVSLSLQIRSDLLYSSPRLTYSLLLLPSLYEDPLIHCDLPLYICELVHHSLSLLAHNSHGLKLLLYSSIFNLSLSRLLSLRELLLKTRSHREQVFLLLQWERHMMLREEGHDEVALACALSVRRALSQVKQLILAGRNELCALT